MPHKECVFCPQQMEAGNREVCSDRGCLGVGQGSLRDRQAGCWASRTGRGLWGELWWRLGFPALGVGLSSCFLLIENLDNATVTQLPTSSMNNSRSVQGQLGSGGLYQSTYFQAPRIISLLVLGARKSDSRWVDFRLLLFGFPIACPHSFIVHSWPVLRWLHADQLPARHPSQALPDLPYPWFEVQWVWHNPWRFWISTQAFRTWMSFRWERQLCESLISSSG